MQEESELVVSDSRRGQKRKRSKQSLYLVSFNNDADTLQLTDLCNMKLIGIETDEPVAQIGHKCYIGEKYKSLYTAVFFEKESPVTEITDHKSQPENSTNETTVTDDNSLESTQFVERDNIQNSEETEVSKSLSREDKAKILADTKAWLKRLNEKEQMSTEPTIRHTDSLQYVCKTKNQLNMSRIQYIRKTDTTDIFPSKVYIM